MTLNQQRNEMYARAEYFAWAARKGFPGCGNDPITGTAPRQFNHLDRALGRVSHAAMARECYRRARRFPNPLP
jgi:hypothetical protein